MISALASILFRRLGHRAFASVFSPSASPAAGDFRVDESGDFRVDENGNPRVWD